MKKLIIFGGIGLVLVLLLGGGAFFFLKSMNAKKAAVAAETAEGAKAEGKEEGKDGKEAKHGKAGEDDDEEEAHGGGGEHGGGGGGAPVMTLNRLIVNLDGRKNAFLKCDIHILFRSGDLGKAAASDKPTAEGSIIRAIVLECISGKTVEAAMDLETRESIRTEIKEKLNEKFANRHSEEEKKAAKKSGKALKPPVKDVLIVDWAIQQ
ncbi:MAG TPA: flagellar basal body-associated FliL family protein [Holophaga sp.]|nr:flagellar basal body-associated FliL family protein [Holophaga sp.]